MRKLEKGEKVQSKGGARGDRPSWAFSCLTDLLNHHPFSLLQCPFLGLAHPTTSNLRQHLEHIRPPECLLND